MTRGGLFSGEAAAAFKHTMDRHWPSRVGGSRAHLGADTVDHSVIAQACTVSRSPAGLWTFLSGTGVGLFRRADAHRGRTCCSLNSPSSTATDARTMHEAWGGGRASCKPSSRTPLSLYASERAAAPRHKSSNSSTARRQRANSASSDNQGDGVHGNCSVAPELLELIRR